MKEIYPHWKNSEYVNIQKRLLVWKRIEGEMGNSLLSYGKCWAGGMRVGIPAPKQMTGSMVCRDYTVRNRRKSNGGEGICLIKGPTCLGILREETPRKDGELEAACVRRSQGKKEEALRWEVQTPGCSREPRLCVRFYHGPCPLWMLAALLRTRAGHAQKLGWLQNVFSAQMHHALV